MKRLNWGVAAACLQISLLPVPPVPEQPSVQPGVQSPVTAIETMETLESRYGISIGRDGEKVGMKSLGASYKVVCREALPAELACLSVALRKSAPAQLDRRGHRGVRIYFLRSPMCCGTKADWALDSNSRPAIFIEPSADEQTLTYTFIHELAHNTAYRLGFNPESTDWSMSAKLGWKSFRNPDTGDSGWLIKLKNNQTYKKCSVLRDWVRADGQGHPLDADGNRTKRQIDGLRLSPYEVIEQAQVTPISMYFPNPMEVYAEGMAHYRASEKMRRALQEVSPDLFDIIENDVGKDCQCSRLSNTVNTATLTIAFGS